jgi:hypothetical protein
MSLFLLTFTRGASIDPEIERFEDPEKAMRKFADRERELRGSDRGVVLLIAENEETLRRTHSHYFETADELLAQLS